MAAVSTCCSSTVYNDVIALAFARLHYCNPDEAFKAILRHDLALRDVAFSTKFVAFEVRHTQTWSSPCALGTQSSQQRMKARSRTASRVCF